MTKVSFTIPTNGNKREGAANCGMGFCCRHQRRGLSTVVTGVMMLSAVAVLGTMVVAWSNSSMFSHQQVLTSTLNTNVNKIKESLVIENIWFNSSSPRFVNITMNNVGTIGLNVTEIQLGNTTTTHQVNQYNDPVLPGQTLSKKISYDWQSNATIQVLIKTARDNIFKTEDSP